jgi:Tol biopolymer transport system component
MSPFKFTFSFLLGATLMFGSANAAFAQTYPQLAGTSWGGVGAGCCLGANTASPISADGRYVAFTSFASTLVVGDTNDTSDIFFHDMVTGSTTRVSVASDGSQATAGTVDPHVNSVNPSISADGRYVAFTSPAPNLAPGDTNDRNDIFVHDMVTGSTTRVSVASDGTQANGAGFPDYFYPSSVSADGRYVTFGSAASNLVPGDTNNTPDMFVHDMVTGATTRVSVASDGTQANGPSEFYASISADGRYVAFVSDASNLVPGDTNGTTDIFVHDMVTGSTTRVSVASDGSQGEVYQSIDPFISADGRYVAFDTTASNLVPDDTNGTEDVFVHDMLTGSTTRADVASDGTQANDFTGAPVISPDGRYVAFHSDASNLVPGDTNGTTDVFVRDMVTGSTTLASVASDGTQGNNFSEMPSVSADSQYVMFFSRASNLVPGDTAGTYDVFLTRNPFCTVNGHHAPVLTPIGNKSVNEGQTLTLAISASDPDCDNLTYSAANLPAGASFNPLTRTFSWTPSYAQAGNYPNVEFTVMDDGSPMQLAFEDITITVGGVNRAPIFAPVGPQTVLEHNPLSFTVSATDPDGNAVTLSASGMPSGATFSTTTGAFSWTPGGSTAGVYTPTFIATDNGSPVATSSIDVVITVGSNPTPTEQAQNVVNTVVAANLPNGVTNSYLANLNKVGTFIQQGKTQQAINQLNAFIQKVNQDYTNGKITLAEKNDFVSLAQNLINALQ